MEIFKAFLLEDSDIRRDVDLHYEYRRLQIGVYGHRYNSIMSQADWFFVRGQGTSKGNDINRLIYLNKSATSHFNANPLKNRPDKRIGHVVCIKGQPVIFIVGKQKEYTFERYIKSDAY